MTLFVKTIGTTPAESDLCSESRFLVDLTSVLCRIAVQSGGWTHCNASVRDCLIEQLRLLQKPLESLCALTSSSFKVQSQQSTHLSKVDFLVNLLYLLTHIFLAQTDYLASVPDDPSTLPLFDLSIRLITKLLPAPPSKSSDLPKDWEFHVEPFLECLMMLEYARLSSRSRNIVTNCLASGFDAVCSLSIASCCKQDRPMHEFLHLQVLTARWCRARVEVNRRLANPPPLLLDSSIVASVHRPPPHQSIKRRVLLVAMAFATEAYAATGNDMENNKFAACAGRDRLRLLELRRLQPQWGIQTINQDEELSHCEPGAHVQAQFCRLGVKDALDAGHFRVEDGPYAVVILDYFAFARRMGEAYRMFFAEVVPALWTAKLVDERTRFILPKLKYADFWQPSTLENRYTILDQRQLTAAENPLWQATEALSAEQLLRLNNRKELDGLEAGRPFVECRLIPKPSLPSSGSLTFIDNLPTTIESIKARCESLRLSVDRSRLNDAGDGLFAQQGFKNGATICHAFGHFMSDSRREKLNRMMELKGFDSSKVVSMSELGRLLPHEIGFVEDFCNGYSRLIDVSDCVSTTNDGFHLVVDRACPMVKINDPRRKQKLKINCRLVMPSVLPMSGSRVSSLAFPIVTTRDILRGEELYLDYGWTDKDWKVVFARSKRPSSSIPSAVWPSLQHRAIDSRCTIQQDQYDAILRQREALCDPDWLVVKPVRDLCLESPSQPCQLGVFTKRALSMKQPLLLYASDWIDRSSIDRDQSAYVRSIPNTGLTGFLDGRRAAAGYVRWKASSPGGWETIFDMPDDAFLPKAVHGSTSLLAEWSGLAKGCMVNSAVGRESAGIKANCRMSVLQGVQVCQAPVLCIKATRDLIAGEELVLASYNHNEERAQREALTSTSSDSPDSSSNRLERSNPLESIRARPSRPCIATPPPRTSTPPPFETLKTPAHQSFFSLVSTPEELEEEKRFAELMANAASPLELEDASSDSDSSTPERMNDDSSDLMDESDARSHQSSSRRVQISPPARDTLRSDPLSLRRDVSKATAHPSMVKELREVWEPYSDLISAAGRQSWHVRAMDYGTPKEQNKADAILAAYNQVKSHCASLDVSSTLKPNQIQDVVRIFKSVKTFFTARMTWQQNERDFDRATVQASEAKLIRSTRGRNAKADWNGCPLCADCMIAALGLPVATAYNRVKTQVDHKTKRRCKRQRIVYQLLQAELNRVGQFQPTARGKQERTLHYTTSRDCRLSLEDNHRQANKLEQHQYTISKTTFLRAKKQLSKDLNCRINLTKTKTVARCNQCQTFHNAVKLCTDAKPFNQTNLELAKGRLDHHHKEHGEQRALYDSNKAKALLSPWLLWLITLDGMDTSKTHLPHFRRVSKHRDNAHTLAMRVLGAFCYGGPVPILAITSFDDVQSKGANASVTNFEHIIDRQFEAMDPTNIAVIPDSSERPKPLVDVALNSNATSSLEATCPAAGSEAPKKIPFMWPEGLHLTFDNTGADCKNAIFFRFLGALVGLGVFCYISINNLMVGHTHDIVDQMFSCWSQALNHNDAPTLAEMHKLFRAKYASKIYAFDAAMHKAAQDNREGRKNTTLPSLAGLPVEVAQHLRDAALAIGVEVDCHRQTYAIDADAWLGNGPGAPKYTVEHLAKAYVFYITRERDVVVDKHPVTGDHIKEEAVVMYTRHLANSFKNPSVAHNFENIRGGPYASRMVLFRMRDLPADFADPMRCPPQFVDVDNPRLCIQNHLKQYSMTPDQVEEMDKLLRGFTSHFAALQKDCPHCATIIQEIHQIGPLSRPRDEDDQKAKAAYNASNNAKKRLRQKLVDHLADRTFVDTHESILRADRWWTKWRDRVRDYITPYYMQRKLIFSPSEEDRMDNGRMKHPHALPRSKFEPPISRLRRDREWHETHPEGPQPYDIVIGRSHDPAQPFYVGIVLDDHAPKPNSIDVQMESEEKKSSEVEASMVEPMPSDGDFSIEKAWSSTDPYVYLSIPKLGDPPRARRPIDSDDESVDGNRPADMAAESKKRKRAPDVEVAAAKKKQKPTDKASNRPANLQADKAKAQAEATRPRLVRGTKTRPQSKAVAASNTNSKAKKHTKKNSKMQDESDDESNDESNDESSDDESDDSTSDTGPNDAFVDRRSTRAAAATASSAAPAVASSKAATQPKADQRAIRRGKKRVVPTQGASASAAASSIGASLSLSADAGEPAVKRAKKKAVEREAAPSAKDSYRVRWFDFRPPPGLKSSKDFVDIAKIDKLIAKESRDDVGQWEIAKHAMLQENLFRRLPKAAVSRWQPIEYVHVQHKLDDVLLVNLIYWGPANDVMWPTRKLKIGAWRRVFDDLCEARDVAANIASRAPSLPAEQAALLRAKSAAAAKLVAR